jgi:hypothetical protein
MHSNLDGAEPISPEQGGDAADELAYRLRQQQLTARFGLFALKTHDIDALLQEATEGVSKPEQARPCQTIFTSSRSCTGDFLVYGGLQEIKLLYGAVRSRFDTGSTGC